MLIGDVNLFPILLSAIIYIFIGGFWYSPTLFGKAWKDLAEKKDEEMRGISIGYLGGFLMALVFSYVLAHIMNLLQVKSLIEGATLAFWFWLGFVATFQFSAVLWEKKPFKLYLINTGFLLVVMIIVGSLLAIWR